ncbi:MAG: S1C family serine protease [Lachnospiraceae bacterium]|nr:S1C family serine protease [Lachnospiraceae bacterium]
MGDKGEMLRSQKTVSVICISLICGLIGGMGGYLIGSVSAGRFPAGTGETQSTGSVEKEGQSSSTEDYETVCQQTEAVDVGEKKQLSPTEIYETACQQTVAVCAGDDKSYGAYESRGISGAGCVISEDGFILTNYHVVENAVLYDKDIEVRLYDGRNFEAEVVEVYAGEDLAVLKISADGLTPIVPGDSDALRVGERIYTIGHNALNLDFTQNNGYISGLERTLSTSIGGEQVTLDFFQMDIHVNSGSSGGPVINEAGETVGIVAAKYSSSGVEGLGFAIPINKVLDTVSHVIK